MPKKLTISKIMRMIDAHNELSKLCPTQHRVGAFFEFNNGLPDVLYSMFSGEYMYSSQEFIDAVNKDYTEEFIDALNHADFKKHDLCSYLEANFDIFNLFDDTVEHYRVVVSIWEC